MHTVEHIPAPDFALEASSSRDSPCGPLGFAMDHPLAEEYRSRSSTTGSNFPETASNLSDTSALPLVARAT
jgi:hypothetical protein